MTIHKGKGKVYHKDCRWSTQLRYLALEPAGGWTTEVCDAIPTVTFPASGHHCRQTGTKLHCLVTKAHVCEQLDNRTTPELITSRVAYIKRQYQGILINYRTLLSALWQGGGRAAYRKWSRRKQL